MASPYDKSQKIQNVIDSINAISEYCESLQESMRKAFSTWELLLDELYELQIATADEKLNSLLSPKESFKDKE